MTNERISIAALREWAEQTPENGGAGRIAPSAALALVQAVEAANVVAPFLPDFHRQALAPYLSRFYFGDVA